MVARSETPAVAGPLEELDRQLAIMRDRVRGVALGHSNGLYLFGRPGTSKTYTVEETLNQLKVPYYRHSGHLTPLGLFDLLAAWPDGAIILDDVAAILAQPVALQILLAALGNEPTGRGARTITYRRQREVVRVDFTGGLICISNLGLNSTPVVQALKSRVHYLEYAPTDEQIAALMLHVAGKGWTRGKRKMSAEECQKVAEFVIAQSKKRNIQLDMRLFVDKAIPDYIQWRDGDTEVHWEDLVTATLAEKLVEPKHPIRATSRRDQKTVEQDLVRAIVASHTATGDRLAAWAEQTGKSERAFYRRLEEVEN